MFNHAVTCEEKNIEAGYYWGLQRLQAPLIRNAGDKKTVNHRYLQ